MKVYIVTETLVCPTEHGDEGCRVKIEAVFDTLEKAQQLCETLTGLWKLEFFGDDPNREIYGDEEWYYYRVFEKDVQG